MMNRYEEALDKFRSVQSSKGADRVSVKYRLKSFANMAVVKCMSGNFREALDLCESVDTKDINMIDRMKHNIKVASVLKKSSCWREGLKLLESMESELDLEIQNKDQPRPEKLMKLMHKVLRDKARLFFLVKDKQSEQETEEASQLVYEMYLKERGLPQSADKKWWGFSILNIKVIKIVFNRAYRIAGSDPEQACELYQEIMAALDELMPSHAQMSYYHAKMYLETAKTFS